MVGTTAPRPRVGPPVTLTLAALLVVLVVGITYGALPGSNVTGAQDAPYRWWLRTADPEGAELVVLPAVDGGWDQYIDASNERLQRWLLEPGSAPDLSGTQVSITFAQPVTPSLLADVIGPLRGTVLQHTAVGRDQRDAWVEETAVGSPGHVAIGSNQLDAGAGYTYTLYGVVSCLVLVGTDGPVDAAMLDRVRSLDQVYLLDTTAVQVTKVDLPAYASDDVHIGTLVIDSPWHLLVK